MKLTITEDSQIFMQNDEFLKERLVFDVQKSAIDVKILKKTVTESAEDIYENRRALKIFIRDNSKFNIEDEATVI